MLLPVLPADMRCVDVPRIAQLCHKKVGEERPCWSYRHCSLCAVFAGAVANKAASPPQAQQGHTRKHPLQVVHTRCLCRAQSWPSTQRLPRPSTRSRW